MTTAIRSGGLQHAASLGNIEISAKINNSYYSGRSYDSEDENMGRKNIRTNYYTKPSIYSKCDIREQYCLTDRQLNSIERPRREKFFGCWSSHGSPNSFLGVCVGRRAPSDENLSDHAPFYRYPRYQNPKLIQSDLHQYDEDLESSYFRRKPSSFLTTGTDAKRYTWMPADEEAVRLEGPRPICQDVYDDYVNGPYIVGSYPPSTYLSQSSDHIAGLYRCPAHIGLPPPPPPPPPVPPDGLSVSTSRIKHVSFARSHTLTSFDEAAMITRPPRSQMNTSKSQERLLGGKKPSLYLTSSQVQPIQSIMHQQRQPTLQQHPLHLHQLHQQQPLQSILVTTVTPPPHEPEPDIFQIEKLKKNAMKSQATQTDINLRKKPISDYNLTLSPRTIHRVKMVSQGAQTNGMLNGRKLTKSLSEAAGGRLTTVSTINTETLQIDQPKSPADHEPLHRTQSEEPPRSPYEICPTQQFKFTKLAPSRFEFSSTSHFPNTKQQYDESDINKSDFSDTVHTHSCNHSQDSFKSAELTMSTKTSEDFSSSTNTTADHHHQRNNTIDSDMFNRINDSDRHFYESNSLPRRKYYCNKEEYFNSLPKRHQKEQQQQYKVIQPRIHQHTHYIQHPIPYHHQSQNFDECPLCVASTTSISKEEPIYSNQIIENSQKRRICQRVPDHIIAYKRPVFQSIVSDGVSGSTNISGSEISNNSGTPCQLFTTEYFTVIDHIHQQQDRSLSDELCSTCESEDGSEGGSISSSGDIVDDQQEKEIFIDFKPKTSPVSKRQMHHKSQQSPSPPQTPQSAPPQESTMLQQSPTKITRNIKKLQKTHSEGEILIDQYRDKTSIIPIGSASEGDLQTPADDEEIDKTLNYVYKSDPIEDEGICDKKNLLKLPDENKINIWRHKREAFRKRSISLEDGGGGTDMENDSIINNQITQHENIYTKSAPPSPFQEENLSIKEISTFPSNDSLANDITKDHSDGIWNESQATVLLAESSGPDSSMALLSPTTKRKNLILQHQQRSSMDTEALEMEDQFFDQQSITQNQQQPNITNTVNTNKIQVPISLNLTMPSIAVTPSQSIEKEEEKHYNKGTLNRRTRPVSPLRRQELRRSSSIVVSEVEPLIHTYVNVESTSVTSSHASDLHLIRTDSGKNNTDISECSTNTEDYITCTDNSKRTTPGTSTKPPSASSSSTTQIPASAQSSQNTITTQEGSSFESASSIYSLARVDAICIDDVIPTTTSSSIEENLQFPNVSPVVSKISPSHSLSSSSSGSFSLVSGIKQMKASPIRTSVVKPIPIIQKKLSESFSEDDKSEKRYSSSGYYESPHDEDNKPSRPRRIRDWNDEERRRRKEKMRLDIEKENMKSLTSPIKKVSPSFKQISPDDRAALNILDGTSPNKAKRLRPKTRRLSRNRSSTEDIGPNKRSGKTSIIYNTERKLSADIGITSPIRITQSSIKYAKSPMKHSAILSKNKSMNCNNTTPATATTTTSDAQLKARSSESLRSVSPGSDSVFYSEIDGLPDNQVHCHHCGKEVEIVTAIATVGSQDSIVVADNDTESRNIVKPPADFADSPNGIRMQQHTTRLYKKLDKRFRSEERHGERKHYRNRQETTRAKSEERGKDTTNQSNILRPAGSSPCVGLPENTFNFRNENQSSIEPEHGIYQGYYRLGTWLCINDFDAWKRQAFLLEERSKEMSERRNSTESEREFRKKYQAITHRLVHRKSCVEMYRRQSSNSFNTDKTITVQRDSGEFGFRIHGSKPVVVSAIEPETPAETSGLEVGDIVLSVNGESVIDKNHSEVVKIAHAGSDVLELEVARTIGLVTADLKDLETSIVYSGYLFRQSGNVSGNVLMNQRWVRRWFCLRSDHCLYYYKSKADTHPVGAILLTNHLIEHCSPVTSTGESVGRPFAFQVSSNETLPMVLAADNEELANKWVILATQAAKQTDRWLEQSTNNLRLPANTVPRPDCFGYLMKLGSRWRAWSKRYCVLKDACLYFYQDGNSKTALGMACLQGYRVQPTSNTAGKKYTFEITPPETKLRHYYMSTESEMDKKRWVAALEYSIDRWMKAG